MLVELDVVAAALGASGTIVEVEEERLKVLASGARWVSLSSGWNGQRNRGEVNVGWIAILFVSFHDIFVV